METLILTFKSEWIIASFSKAALISFSDDALIIKVKKMCCIKSLKLIDK